jgi:hypothetical protein
VGPSIFQKELLFDLTSYPCPQCENLDLEAIEFKPVLSIEEIVGLGIFESRNCGLTWDPGYLFSEQQYGELVEQRCTEWPAVR